MCCEKSFYCPISAVVGTLIYRNDYNSAAMIELSTALPYYRKGGADNLSLLLSARVFCRQNSTVLELRVEDVGECMFIVLQEAQDDIRIVIKCKNCKARRKLDTHLYSAPNNIF
ncbi:hypothetical protein DXN04_17135 [Chitinophaga silvisoli]|uniref:Uncharacterized protein n=1 Tax=Chitinophaga silvisoli TaxID=2291814 RepID=A0A3E1P0N8_9BACT|nr:hypothetical protein DXN04_17135 [Chitinophaga silvisoli]